MSAGREEGDRCVEEYLNISGNIHFLSEKEMRRYISSNLEK